MPLDVQVALKLRNQGELDQLIRRVSTPGSPDYGHYLTPDEFGARFGPTGAQVAAAAAFLEASGFQVTAAAPGSTLVDARGTVAAAERAFHTRIGRYRDRAAHDFFANDAAPHLPASLASIVVGVQGPSNRYQRHHSAVVPRVCPPTCASSPYTPAQIRTAYRLATAPLGSVTGSGQTLALLELADFQQANIDGYNATYGLAAVTPSRQVVDGGPLTPINNFPEIEVELDIEVMHAIAPAAGIMVFEGPNNDQGLIDTYSCMVNPGGNQACPNFVSRQVAQSNSTSWGLCEPDQLTGTTDALHSIFSRAAAQGQSFFAASGDGGAAADCLNRTLLAVDSPASDPFVIGAGGTTLLLNAADNSYKSEVAWAGSGGGMSAVYSRPTWQTGPGVDASPGATRQVPDISLDADPATGYSIYTCRNASGSCSAGSTAGLIGVGGTSAVAPAWAAFTAVYNQYAATQSRPNLGFANPTLYQLGSCPQTFPPFNDITSGNNNPADPAHYSAGVGYDKATGWGSLRGSDFAQDMTGSPGALQLTSITPVSGTTSGGTPVTLSGCGFISGVTVKIDGSTLAPNVQFVSPTTLTANMPPHPAGQAAVTVVNPGGATATLPGSYTYIVPPPPRRDRRRPQAGPISTEPC